MKFDLKNQCSNKMNNFLWSSTDFYKVKINFLCVPRAQTESKPNCLSFEAQLINRMAKIGHVQLFDCLSKM